MLKIGSSCEKLHGKFDGEPDEERRDGPIAQMVRAADS